MTRRCDVPSVGRNVGDWEGLLFFLTHIFGVLMFDIPLGVVVVSSFVSFLIRVTAAFHNLPAHCFL